MSGPRLGLFGGTFDPPHLGHLVVAQDALEQLALDRVVFVVAGQPPHKRDRRVSPARLRLAMVRKAVEGNARFEVSEVEINREGPSYSVDTLRYYRSLHPEGTLFFLVGADQIAEFRDWHEPDEVARLAVLVALSRDGPEGERLPETGFAPGTSARFTRLSVPRLDLSSSDVRRRVQEGRSIRYMVPRGVLRIIEDHGLYRTTS